MTLYEYTSENGSGNLHDAARFANIMAKDGWRLVAVSSAGYSYVAIFERKKHTPLDIAAPRPGMTT